MRRDCQISTPKQVTRTPHWRLCCKTRFLSAWMFKLVRGFADVVKGQSVLHVRGELRCTEWHCTPDIHPLNIDKMFQYFYLPENSYKVGSIGWIIYREIRDQQDCPTIPASSKTLWISTNEFCSYVNFYRVILVYHYVSCITGSEPDVI